MSYRAKSSISVQIGAGEALRCGNFRLLSVVISIAYTYWPIYLLDALLDVSFDARLGSPATQNSFCHYGNPRSTCGNACISNTAFAPNMLAPTTSRDRTRSQSISSLATSFEFGICVHPHFSCDEDVID